MFLTIFVFGRLISNNSFTNVGVTCKKFVLTHLTPVYRVEIAACAVVNRNVFRPVIITTQFVEEIWSNAKRLQCIIIKLTNTNIVNPVILVCSLFGEIRNPGNFAKITGTRELERWSMYQLIKEKCQTWEVQQNQTK